MEAMDGQQEDLLLRMKTGDRDAFRQLYESSARAVYAYALSIIRSPQDAEEIMQDAFLTAWTCCGDYVPSGKPLAWLFTITRNLCYGRMRREARAGVSLESLKEQESGWEPADLCAPIEQAPEQQALLKALGMLSEDERRLVLLHTAAGMKHREIAETFHIPLSTVLSRYSRAIRKLKEALE